MTGTGIATNWKPWGYPVPPHPDVVAFLAAIRAAPDDDTARLVFADWLEEHGEAKRAGFIRQAVAHPCAEFVALTATAPWQFLGFGCLGYKEFPPDPWAGRRVKRGMGWGWSDLPQLGACVLDMMRELWYHVHRGLIDTVKEHAPGAWINYGDGLLEIHPVRRCVLHSTPKVKHVGTTFENGAGNVFDIRHQFVMIPLHLPDYFALAARWPGVTFVLADPEYSGTEFYFSATRDDKEACGLRFNLHYLPVRDIEEST